MDNKFVKIATLIGAQIKSAVNKDGVDVGTLEGYLSKWGELDDGEREKDANGEPTGRKYADMCAKGSFDDSLDDFVKHGFLSSDHDFSTDGMIGTIDSAKEDDEGLLIKSTFHSDPAAQAKRTRMKERLDRGKSAHLSIGYTPKEYQKVMPADYDTEIPKYSKPGMAEANLAKAKKYDYVRILKKNKLHEGAIVPEGMLESAQIHNVKGADMQTKGAQSAPGSPFANQKQEWDASAADKRIRKATGAEEKPNAKYRKCFLWYDSVAADKYGSYKLLICDEIEGKIKIVPRAVYAVAAVLEGGRGGVDIPDADKAKIKKTVSALYKRMAKAFGDDTIVAPWDKEEKSARGERQTKGTHFTDTLADTMADRVRAQTWDLFYAFQQTIRDIDEVQDQMDAVYMLTNADDRPDSESSDSWDYVQRAIYEALNDFTDALRECVMRDAKEDIDNDREGLSDALGNNGAFGTIEQRYGMGISRDGVQAKVSAGTQLIKHAQIALSVAKEFKSRVISARDAATKDGRRLSVLTEQEADKFIAEVEAISTEVKSLKNGEARSAEPENKDTKRTNPTATEDKTAVSDELLRKQAETLYIKEKYAPSGVKLL